MSRRLVLALAAAALAGGCEKKEFSPPDRAVRVAEAEAEFTPALFDTIAWESEETRLRAGNEAFAVHCRSCHGSLGRGATPYARSRDLDVPSLVEADWEMADDVPAVRRRIYTGHPGGMPTWGIGGLAPREIDAVAYYIVERLRGDVVEGTTGEEAGG
jgi:mono/diheme cytochrome c family protein